MKKPYCLEALEAKLEATRNVSNSRTIFQNWRSIVFSLIKIGLGPPQLQQKKLHLSLVDPVTLDELLTNIFQKIALNEKKVEFQSLFS